MRAQGHGLGPGLERGLGPGLERELKAQGQGLLIDHFNSGGDGGGKSAGSPPQPVVIASSLLSQTLAAGTIGNGTSAGTGSRGRRYQKLESVNEHHQHNNNHDNDNDNNNYDRQRLIASEGEGGQEGDYQDMGV